MCHIMPHGQHSFVTTSIKVHCLQRGPCAQINQSTHSWHPQCQSKCRPTGLAQQRGCCCSNSM
jgi:hypothetical protein